MKVLEVKVHYHEIEVCHMMSSRFRRFIRPAWNLHDIEFALLYSHLTKGVSFLFLGLYSIDRLTQNCMLRSDGGRIWRMILKSCEHCAPDAGYRRLRRRSWAHGGCCSQGSRASRCWLPRMCCMETHIGGPPPQTTSPRRSQCFGHPWIPVPIGHRRSPRRRSTLPALITSRDPNPQSRFCNPLIFHNGGRPTTCVWGAYNKSNNEIRFQWNFVVELTNVPTNKFE